MEVSKKKINHNVIMSTAVFYMRYGRGPKEIIIFLESSDDQLKS